MNRALRLLLIIALATLALACSPMSDPVAPSDPPRSPVASAAGAPQTPTPAGGSPSVGPAGSPSLDVEVVLTATGIGPYQVGATVADLEARNLIANIVPSTNCDSSWQWAEATSDVGGDVSVGFHDGRMIRVTTADEGIATASGGRVGMSRDELESIYGDRATLIEGQAGNIAYSVRDAGTQFGIVLYLDSTNTSVQAIGAGEAELLEQAAVVGEGC
jgi:hypothetical protein